MSTIELIRELILVAAAFLFILGSMQLAFHKNVIGGILLGYGTVPFAVDCIVHHLYIYFLVWVTVCYIAFHLVYEHTCAEKEEFDFEFDNILNDD